MKEVWNMSARGGKYFEVGPGVEVFVQDVGNGEPIVFIPGVGLYDRSFFQTSRSVLENESCYCDGPEKSWPIVSFLTW